MDKDYQNSKEFWNKSFVGAEADAIEGKWVEDKTFNDVISRLINKNSNVLDYGCGSGWALFEIFFTTGLKEGLGIDQGKDIISYCQKSLSLSKNIKGLSFVCGDQEDLKTYQKHFDCIVCFNVIDVLPDDVIESIFKAWDECLKDNGRIIVGINPSFPKDFLTKLGFEFREGFLYKDGILRGNDKSTEEWENLLSDHFKIDEYHTFALTEGEKTYPRRMFVLSKKQ